MLWGPYSEKETRDFISAAITDANEKPCTNYIFAADLKNTGALIGSCNLTLAGEEGEMGWIVHRDYWRRGFGTEMGKALLRFGFESLGLHRILAHCMTENHGSYRIMEKIGMRREGLFLESRPAHKGSAEKYADEFSYAVLEKEWRAQNGLVGRSPVGPSL